MSYRGERFSRSLRSLEMILTKGIDASKARILSDKGKSLERMVAALDYDEARETAAEQEREDRLFAAEMRLVEAGKRHLIQVLLLIVKNRANREESLRHISSSTYYLHRDQLLKFFTRE